MPEFYGMVNRSYPQIENKIVDNFYN